MLSLILIIILAFAAQSFLPWWTVAVVVFAVAWVRIPSGGKAFLIGFSAVFVLWLAMAAFLTIGTGSFLTEKIATTFSLPQDWLAFPVTAVLGGIVGGFSAASGSMIRSSFFRKRQ